MQEEFKSNIFLKGANSVAAKKRYPLMWFIQSEWIDYCLMKNDEKCKQFICIKVFCGQTNKQYKNWRKSTKVDRDGG